MVVSVRQKQRLYYTIAGATLAIVGGVMLFLYLNTGNADDAYAAGSDSTKASGLWNDNSIWNSGTYPGYSINKNIEIFENVTSLNSLTIINGNTLTVTDTLVIHGNLQLDNKSNLIIGENGILVVTGNLTSTNKLTIASGGVIAVGGDVDLGNQSTYEPGLDSELYVVGTADPKVSGKNLGEDQLIENFPDIYNIFQGTTTTLPITLLSFDATVQQQEVLLEWVTESEIDNDYFTIERSVDGQNPEAIGTLAGAGSSQTVRSYSWVDEKPLPGISYYRLRQTDYNGQTEAFDWVAISFVALVSDHSELSIDQIFPNPFSTSCSLAYTLSRPGPVAIELLDLQGNTVISRVAKGYTGENQYTLDNLQGLQPGTYLVRIIHNNTVSPVQRVLKR